MREVYVFPTGEFRLGSRQLLGLYWTLYGLSGARDDQNVTFSRHIQDDICMKPTTRNFPLFFKEINGKLAGMIVAYIDDTVGTGDDDLIEALKSTEQKSRSKSRVYDKFV